MSKSIYKLRYIEFKSNRINGNNSWRHKLYMEAGYHSSDYDSFIGTREKEDTSKRRIFNIEMRYINRCPKMFNKMQLSPTILEKRRWYKGHEKALYYRRNDFIK